MIHRLILVGLAALALASGPARAAPQEGDMSLASASAKIEVIEYASVTCGHCAIFNRDVFPAFRKKYIDTGRVRYTLREALTPPYEVAAAGFLTARCAGPSKYFPVVDAMYRELPVWSRTGKALDSIVRAGAVGGLTSDEVRACIGDEGALRALRLRVDRSGAGAGVRSTPTFMVNGRIVKVGSMSLAELDAAIAKASKR